MAVHTHTHTHTCLLVNNLVQKEENKYNNIEKDRTVLNNSMGLSFRVFTEKGITLIALIITVIIMLILAGVAISTIAGEEGLFARAKKVTSLWQEESMKEKQRIDEIITAIDEAKGLIPIYKSEELLKAGTGAELEIGEKTYKLDKGKTYVLQNDIEYNGSYDEVKERVKNGEIVLEGNGNKIVVTTDEGVKEYYTENSKYYIATNKQGYVLNGLELYYDGIDNAGEDMHSNGAGEWKDLSGKERNGILNNFGNSAISGWSNDHLSLDGVNDWVNCGQLNVNNLTIEVLCMMKSYNTEEKVILGNINKGGYAICTRNDALYSEFHNNKGYQDIPIMNNTKNKLITESMTYNGQEEIFYIDGSENGKIVVNGDIKSPSRSTVLAIGVNPVEASYSGNFADIDVYTVRVYNRGLDQEEIEVNNKADEIRFKNKEVIGINNEEELNEALNTKGKVYELRGDITYNSDYSSLLEKINNKEIEIRPNEYKINNNGNYYTGYGKYTIATNKYGYVTNGLEVYYDGIDNTGTGNHSNDVTEWKDLSGKGRDGVLKNITDGWEDEGLNFDGTDDYVLIDEMNYQDITMEAVCLFREFSDTISQDIISNVDAGGYSLHAGETAQIGFSVYIQEQGTYCYVENSSEPKMEANKKYTVSASHDSIAGKSNIRTITYLESAIPGTITYPIKQTNIVLGANPTGTEGKGNFMNGTIYSARIYSRALTDEEMSVNLLNDRERYNL